MKGIKKSLASLLVGVASFGLTGKVKAQYPQSFYISGDSGIIKLTYDGNICTFDNVLVNPPNATLQDIVVNPWNNNPVVAHGAEIGRVVEYDKDTGQNVKEYLVPSFVFGLAYNNDGNLFVGSGNNGDGEVYRFDGFTGASLGVFVAAANSGGISGPHDIEFGPDGNLYVITPRAFIGIFKYNGETGELIQPAPFIPTANVLPRVFTFGLNGNIFFEDGEYDGNTGSWIRNMPCASGGQSDSIFAHNGLIYSADGNIYNLNCGYVTSCGIGGRGIALVHPQHSMDVDNDGDVDLNDYFFFQNCMTAPAENATIQCWVVDLDFDVDVDVKDFAEFQREFGPSECLSDQECNDNNPYTYDVCLSPGTPSSACTYYQVRCLNGSDCNDNDPYTFDNCLNPGLPNSECAYQPIRCLSDNDCGLDGLVGNPFCVGNNVYQEYVDFTCLNPAQANALCQSASNYVLLEDCINECLNGSCQ